MSTVRHSLLVEHVEEAAWLYDFCASAPEDNDFGWRDAHEFELRREAHLDALRVGGEEAFAVALERVGEGPGERFVHCALALDRCRTSAPGDANGREDGREDGGAVERWLELASAPEPGDLPLARAQAMALVSTVDDAGLARLAAGSGASARPCVRTALIVALEARGLGWPGSGPDAGRLDRADADAPEHRARAIALELRDGDAAMRRGLLDRARDALAERDDALVADAAVGADRQLADAVHERASDAPSDASVRALGLFGLPEHVGALLDALASPAAPEAAAALFAMTGAPLFDSDDETSESDDGEPVPRPSTDTARWKRWLTAHRNRFETGRRHRLGRPFGARCLIDAVTAADAPQRLRRASANELMVRYRLGAGREPAPPSVVDLGAPVAVQAARLRALAALADGLDESAGSAWSLAPAARRR